MVVSTWGGRKYFIPAAIVRSLSVLFIFLLFLITACGAKEPVRHLSSDVCLVMPEKTTRQEVLSFMGNPDQRQVSPEGDEKWIYARVKKSFWRQTPLIGNYFGFETYDVVTVTFLGDKVFTCVYRELDEKDYKDNGSGSW
ncbi:MAG: hypothetical protein KKB30_11100 [Proteobacteria bacterium]|nr:hypothetical protein [Pseudomonadota bacterium]MBU1714314.1 hypothetical protein [Pseudomonadota bacterium]